MSGGSGLLLGGEEGHEERTPLAGPNEPGGSFGLCELQGSQRLAGEWPRRAPNQGLLEQTEPASAYGTRQPRGCLLSCPVGPPSLWPRLVASFCLSLDSHLHRSLSSTSAFWTPFPLHYFRELCLGLHIFSSPGFFCWMRTKPTTAV